MIMWQDFLSYWNSLWEVIPIWRYEVGLFVFLIGMVICLKIWGFRKGFRFNIGLLLIEYVVLIYCTTVFSRRTTVLQYNFMPFWSYFSYFGGENDRLLMENIMNVVVFVPVGLLAGVAFRGMKWMKVMVTGLGLSIGIEVMQFVFRKGFSEVDDVIHNTFGCMIGYLIWLALK